MQEAAARGLDYSHLALYLCGDNLYPTIRDVPPVRGEEPTLPNGKLMGTYKYWSPIAQQTMVDHVRGLAQTVPQGDAASAWLTAAHSSCRRCSSRFPNRASMRRGRSDI